MLFHVGESEACTFVNRCLRCQLLQGSCRCPGEGTWMVELESLTVSPLCGSRMVLLLLRSPPVRAKLTDGMRLVLQRLLASC